MFLIRVFKMEFTKLRKFKVRECKITKFNFLQVNCWAFFLLLKALSTYFQVTLHAKTATRAAIVHLTFWAGSTFPVLVCTVPSFMVRTSRCNKVNAVRLYASYTFT